MRLNFGQFRQLVRRLLREDVSDGISLSDGEVAPENSPEHIRDLQAILAGLMALKRIHKYGTASRVDYARASNRLAREIDRRQATGVVISAEPEIDPDSIDVVDDEAEMPPRTFASEGESGYEQSMPSTKDPGIPQRR